MLPRRQIPPVVKSRLKSSSFPPAMQFHFTDPVCLLSPQSDGSGVFGRTLSAAVSLLADSAREVPMSW